MEKKRGQGEDNVVVLAERLRKQVVYGCGESSCIGIFCKISDVESFAGEIVHILLEYGSYFTCRSLYLVHGRNMHQLANEASRSLNQLSIYPNRSVCHLGGGLDLGRGVAGKGSSEESGVGKSMHFDYAWKVLEYLHHDLSTGVSGLSAWGGFSAGGTPNWASCIRSGGMGGRSDEETGRIMAVGLARIVHQKKSKATSIMLQGVFYNELNKQKVAYSGAAAVRVIKLFNAVKESVKFEKKYFIRFLEMIEEMCQRESVVDRVCQDRCNRMAGGLSYNRPNDCGFAEEEEFVVPSGGWNGGNFGLGEREIEVCIGCGGSLGECELPQCDSLCFLAAKMCVNELIDLIRSLIIVIDNTSVINMREGTLLIAILKCLKALYEFAVKSGTVHHSVFINRRFSRMLNYKVEIRYHKEGGPSILDYPFILDIAAKSDLIQIENTDRMKNELQDAFFRSLFEGKIPPYLNFEVRRETLVEDSVALLENLKPGMVWKQLKIKFLGEDGVDSGGIKKEFFQILSQRTLEHWDIFEERNGFLWIRSMPGEEMAKKEREYFLLGCILGLAAYNGAVLSFYFPHVFYKKMLGQETIVEDIKQIDPVLYNSLVAMRGMSSEELSALSLVFSGGANKEDRVVTKDNIEDFILAYKREAIDSSTDFAIECIRKGLWSICGNTFVSSLLPCELSILIGGMECQNLEEIEKYTIYNGYKRDSCIVQYFWEIFREYDKSMQKKFLRFVTGSDRAPSGGLGRMAIIFMRNGGDTERLPSSQTCFNTLLIPEYATKDKLKEKLNMAIGYTEGFFLL
ncbi:ubiquitin-protein ligase E3 A [Nematocida homosporus]|uniref:ubiquitin-protein ligase E3 A n=1 Tax=Nematocida homosporus TaxID=1912981 RepID=UPI002220BFF7|nr:ubiquitin-protein ligase E3 A [Nematocida homosporus]KAI5185603.1 ubiquitin-protein ligase E3 A [Nematocida homosporus]